MYPIQLPRLSLILFVLFGLLCSVSSTPAAAQRLRERAKKVFSTEKEEPPPVVRMADEIPGATPTTPVDGRRNVLLVSVPIHGAPIPTGSTIAFIDFDHIEEKISTMYSETSSRVRTGAGGDTDVDFKQDIYSSEVCVAQVASALAQHLADLNRFRVVTRSNIDSILREQRFQYSGSVNTTTAAKLGELIGADILIYGEVQLCISSKKDFDELLTLASQHAPSAGSLAGSPIPLPTPGGLVGNILEAVKAFKPEKLRAFVMAQIQLIEAQTGKQVFTTSLVGKFGDTSTSLQFDMGHRELVARAADDLANSFIDKFLARPEPQYIGLYMNDTWSFDRGIDLIQLGDCLGAESYFRAVYKRYRDRMGVGDIAKLMYNQGVALLCSNQPDAAEAKLWASLRLSNDPVTFAALTFAYDTVDRGRRLRAETDTMIEDVREGRYHAAPRPPRVDASGFANPEKGR